MTATAAIGPQFEAPLPSPTQAGRTARRVARMRTSRARGLPLYVKNIKRKPY